MAMKFRLWIETDTLKGYGGPAFPWENYRQEYENHDFRRYNQLYDDVQLELDNLAPKLLSVWKAKPQDLIWFSDSLDPVRYTSGMTVDSVWAEDLQGGIDYFSDLVEWLNQNEGEPIDPNELKQYDRTKMKCIWDLLSDYEWENLRDDDWDYWGPYQWQPMGGEWERCRRIAHDHQEYPVTVLVNGSMIDGAHRLAVGIYKRHRSYPCFVGVPEFWFTKRRRK